ncbi:MAG: radical SAM protein [Desulfobacteraceae bacterium]|nr:MAG: radical SAM protein [Desulfobacteraceae bacterium]
MTLMRFILEEMCLEVTNSCTMECKHCSSSSIKVGKGIPNHMPITVVNRIVQEFADSGGKILQISGGEPLVYPYLRELCKHARDLRLEVRLYTSGIRCDDGMHLKEIVKSQIEDLRSQGVERIVFNLEGSTPTTHERVTGVKGSHQLVLNGIRNAKKAGMWTGVHFVPMKPNAREFPSVIQLCDSLGVDEVAILRFVPQGRGKENQSYLELAPKEFNMFLKSILHLKNEYPEMNIRAGCPMDFLSFYDHRIKPHHCKAGLSTCVISPQGDVLPCPGFKNSSVFRAGNIYRESLADIWTRGFESLRGLDISSIEYCRNCSRLDICEARCAAQRYLSHGSIFIGPDPGCPRLLPMYPQGVRESESSHYPEETVLHCS